MKKIVIFGSDSTLSNKFKKKIKDKFIIINFNKKKLNFAKKDSVIKIHQILKTFDPDIILNFAAVLGTKNDNYEKVFDINFMPNYEIIKFYTNQKLNKKVNIILIGSTSFKKGKGNYVLYTASKAALNNLYQAAKEIFEKTSVKVSIFHPPRFKSKLIKNLKYNNKLKNIDGITDSLLKYVK